ncbi:GNAT family N-acetyltransferase [Pedobacter ginsengisoli]|uniref:GNAT family N-acetyltransferase n=1 Tax=Pedobacter ginsengisoli TaxID=363852 RepID=A0A2D1UB74_9SPHI|nr:GNAT family N-acetyltransferase [Pedobacter ginsengisoli]ATP58843.1 GNAT family N-acetyltransferase [Pedobacter ginsengisoli]
MPEVHIEQIRTDLTWRIRHEVMYPDLPFDAIKLANDEEGIHFGLFVGNQLASVVSLFNKGNIYQFRKFATIVELQGKGYGSLLLDHIISFVKTFGAIKLWCNARVSAIPFYNKFGFIQTDKISTNNGIDFVIMELELNN